MGPAEAQCRRGRGDDVVDASNGWIPDGLGGYNWIGECAAQLGAAQIIRYLTPIAVTDRMVTAHSFPHQTTIIEQLLHDDRFASGALHGLHVTVGLDRRDFRAYRGALGKHHKGSLQIVIDATTGNFYADIDAWNPYEDVISWVGHAFGEVVPHWLRRKRDPHA